MSRWSWIITAESRRTIMRWLERAPEGYRVELREPTRSDAQNKALWPLLTEIARQRPERNGVRWDADMYKAAFMHGVGQEVRFLPTLDGNGMFPYGHRSSQLGVSEFSDLLEYIHAWCAREGLTIQHFDQEAA